MKTKAVIITLLIPSSIQKRAFGYPRVKLGLVEKEVLVLPMLSN